MEDTRKDSMARMAGAFGVRYTRKQKEAFLRYLEGYAKECGLSVRRLTGGERAGRAVHLLAGSLQNADKVIAVAYDTPSRLFFGKSVYRPLNHEENFRSERKEMALRTLSGLILLALYGIFAYGRFLSSGQGMVLVWMAVSAVVIAVLLRLIAGMPNRYNFGEIRRGSF